MSIKLFQAAVVTAAIALATGCATNSDIEAVRSEAAAAQKTADEAKAAAAAAQQAADEAKQTAEAAKQSADEANAKIERSFKKSMYK
jgi:murein lipoprotein